MEQPQTLDSVVSTHRLNDVGDGSVFYDERTIANKSLGKSESPAQDARLGQLWVKIISARNLRDADWMPGDKSDPYCICEIKNKPKSKFQTMVVDNNLNPVWNREDVIEDYTVGDELEFTVYDQDQGQKRDLLGRATLTSEQFHPNGFDGELPLRDAGRGVKSFLKLKVSYYQDQKALSRRVDAGDASAVYNDFKPASRTLRSSAINVEDGKSQQASLRNSLPAHYEAEMGFSVDEEGLSMSQSSQHGGVQGDEDLAGTVDLRPGALPVQLTSEGSLKARSQASAEDYQRSRGTEIGQDESRRSQGAAAQSWAESRRSQVPGSRIEESRRCQFRVEESRQSQVLEVREVVEVRTEVIVVSEESRCSRIAVEESRRSQGGDARVEFSRHSQVAGAEVRSEEFRRSQTAVTGTAVEDSHHSQLEESRRCQIAGSGTDAEDSRRSQVDPGESRRSQMAGAGIGAEDSRRSQMAGAESRSYQLAGAETPIEGSRHCQWAQTQVIEVTQEDTPLDITIVSAKGLRDADFLGKSDPYCVCEVAGKQVLKTPVKSSTLNPVWNHSIHIDYYRVSEPLVFSVFDKDVGSKDDLLGTVTIHSKSFLKEGLEEEVPLEKAGKKGATLLLKITPTPAAVMDGFDNLQGSVCSEGVFHLLSETQHSPRPLDGESEAAGGLLQVPNGKSNLSLNVKLASQEFEGGPEGSVQQKSGLEGGRHHRLKPVGDRSRQSSAEKNSSPPNDLDAVRARLRRVEGQTRTESRKSSLEPVQLRHVEGQAPAENQKGGLAAVQLRHVDGQAQAESKQSKQETVVLRSVEQQSQAEKHGLEETSRASCRGGEALGSRAAESRRTVYEEESRRSANGELRVGEESRGSALTDVSRRNATEGCAKVEEGRGQMDKERSSMQQARPEQDSSAYYTAHDTEYGNVCLLGRQSQSQGGAQQDEWASKLKSINCGLENAEVSRDESNRSEWWQDSTAGKSSTCTDESMSRRTVVGISEDASRRNAICHANAGSSQHGALECQSEDLPLDITIVGARGLRDADIMGKSDPFCVCEVAGKQVLKTKVVSNTLKPTWNQTARLPSYKTHETLVFSVFDQDVMSKADLLGKVEVNSKSFSSSGFDGEIPLEQAGKGAKAFIMLKITPAFLAEDCSRKESRRGAQGMPTELRSAEESRRIAQETGVHPEESRGGAARGLAARTEESRRAQGQADIVEESRRSTSGKTVAAVESGSSVQEAASRTAHGRPVGIEESRQTAQGAAVRAEQSRCSAQGAVTGAAASRCIVQETTVSTEDSCRRSMGKVVGAEESRQSVHGLAVAQESRRSGMEVSVEEDLVLDVLVVGAKGLRNADMLDKSDPFCTCDIAEQQMLKTDVVFNNLNPVWDQGIRIASYKKHEPLVFSIYDKDTWSKADLLGTVTMTSESFISGFEGDVPLQEAGKSSKAFITLIIMPVKAAHLEKESTTGTAPFETIHRQTGLNNKHREAMVPMTKNPAGPVVPHADQTELSRRTTVEVSQAESRRSVVGHVGTTCHSALEGSEAELLLEIIIVGAKGLRGADMDKSDTFCICEIEGQQVLKTKVVYNDLNPVWRQGVRVSGYRKHELLIFSIYDKETWSMGTLTMNSESFLRSGFEGDLPLEGVGKANNATLSLQVKPVKAAHLESRSGIREDIQLETVYRTQVSTKVCKEDGVKDQQAVLDQSPAVEAESRRRAVGQLEQSLRGAVEAESRRNAVGQLDQSRRSNFEGHAEDLVVDVVVVGAKGLRNADMMDKSDPFCICEINGHQVLKTKVINNNLNPVWDEGVRVAGYQKHELLVFSIYDKDAFSKSDLLGTVTVKSESFFASGFEGDVPLEKAGKGSKAFITLKIEIAKAARLEGRTGTKEGIQLRHVDGQSHFEGRKSSLEVVNLRRVEMGSRPESRKSSVERVNLRHVEGQSRPESRKSSLERVNLRHVEVQQKEAVSVNHLQYDGSFLQGNYVQKDAADVGKLQKDTAFLSSPEKNRPPRAVGKLQYTPPKPEVLQRTPIVVPRSGSRVRNMVSDIEHRPHDTGSAPSSRPSSRPSSVVGQRPTQ